MEVVVLLPLLLLLPFSASAQSGNEEQSVLEVSVFTDGQYTAGEEQFMLKCNVSLPHGESLDGLTVEWLAPNSSVVESGSGSTQLTHTLNPLLPSHGGEYRCRATLQGGQELLGEDTVNVTVSVPPPEVTTQYKAVPAGYLLLCYALLIEDTPLLVDGLTMEWLDQYGSSLEKRSGTSIPVVSDGRRRLGISHKPQMTSDGGDHTCQVSLSSENMFIALQQPTVKRVMYTVIVMIPTPSVTITAPSGPLYVGDSLTLQCQVEISDAVDTPVDVSYTWKKSGATIAGDSNTLIIMSVTTSTGGSYSCEAMVTPSGSTEFILPSGIGIDTTDVVVQDWTPTVDLVLAAGRVLEVSPYNSFSLTCSSTSPVLGLVSVFTWSEQSSSGDSVELIGNESVAITTPSDDSSELRVTTSVAGEHIIVCSVSFELLDGSMKTNSAQEAVPVQGPVAPLEPVEVGTVGKASRTAVVEWTVPMITYTPESYVVEFGEDSGSLSRTSGLLHSGDDITVVNREYTTTLQDLKPYTTYHFRVKSTNSFSDTYSIEVTFTTIESAPDGPPQNLMVTASGSRVLQLSWDSPEEDKNNGEITGYQVECNSVVSSKVEALSGGITSITVENLIPFTFYDCSVSASNVAGNGPKAYITGTTAEEAPGDAPHSVIVTDKSSSELSVEWKPPLLPYGILTHYSLYVNFTNGSDLRREDTRDGDTTSHTLTHLQPFQLVVVQVSASTSVAEGPRSIASENRTLEAAPWRVGSISIAVASSSSVNITWEEPQEPNGIISYYLVRLTIRSADEVECVSVQVDTTSLTVEELSPGVPYFVSIVAATSVGEGEPNQKVFFTEERVPSVSPSGVRVERLNSTAMNVSWTLLTLEEARGFVTSYTVSYRKDEGMAKRTTESVVVPGGEQSRVVIGGLDPGSSYLVSVSASTSTGTGEMSEPVSVPATTLNECSANFGYGFAAGLVSGVLVSCGLAGLVAAGMFFTAKKRRQRPKTLSHGKDGIEMAECAAYGTTGFAPPTATKDQKQQESEDQAHVYDVVSPVAVRPA